MTVEAVLIRGAQRIEASPAIDVWQEWQPQADAEILLAEVVGRRVTVDMLDDTVSAAQLARFDELVARRVTGEPVALVAGHIEFDGLDLATRHGVFVPRLSSETTAQLAAARLRRFRNPVAVDIATGSGPLALAMAHRVPAAQVWGLDIAADAVALCRHNARRLHLPNAHFRVSDVFAGLPRSLRGEIAVATVHPPYVAGHEVEHLPDEIRNFEPVHTLTDTSDDGLGLLRLAAAEILDWLRPGGWWIVEVGPHLLRRTQTLLRRSGLADIEWQRDDAGVTRIIAGRRPRR